MCKSIMCIMAVSDIALYLQAHRNDCLFFKASALAIYSLFQVHSRSIFLLLQKTRSPFMDHNISVLNTFQIFNSPDFKFHLSNVTNKIFPILYILCVLGHCLCWDTLDFCQNNYYTPGIYAKGYIVFIFPFVCSWFPPVRGVTLKFYVKVSQMGYVSPTTHQKAFIFGP